MIRNTILLFSIVLLCCFRAEKEKVVLQSNSTALDGPCAVFVAPTSAQLDSMRAHMKEQDFYSMTDDYMAYMSSARTFLETKKIPMSNVDANGSLKFKKQDGKIFEMKLSGLKWAVILFNGKNDPIIANMVGIENDYQRYMK
jgi:hypothetical protein